MQHLTLILINICCIVIFNVPPTPLIEFVRSYTLYICHNSLVIYVIPIVSCRNYIRHREGVRRLGYLMTFGCCSAPHYALGIRSGGRYSV